MIHLTGKTKETLNLSPVPGINRELDFRRYAIVYGIITDIPWEEDESEAFDGRTELMRKTVEAGLNQRGETVHRLPYDAQTWNIEGTKISFKRVSDELFHKVRKFVLFELIKTDWRSPETISGHVKRISRFFNEYCSAKPYAHVKYIHTSDIINFMEDSDITLSSKSSMLSSLVEFYRFCVANYVNDTLPVDIDRLEEYRSEVNYEYYRTKEPGHYPSIPDRIFYQLHFKMMELIRNPGTPYDDAVTACMVILHMWTGLRPKEIRFLRRRCMVQYEEDGKRLSFYEGISPKNSNRVQTFLLFPAALEAIKKLEHLQVRRETVFISDYLVSFWDHQINEPESYDAVANAYNGLLCKYMAEELSVPHEDLSAARRQGVVIYRPTFYAYRVHLCTYLIDHGYDERWVESHLGHLSETIRGRYYRMKEWRRADIRTRIVTAIPEAQTVEQDLTNTIAGMHQQGKRKTIEDSILDFIKQK